MGNGRSTRGEGARGPARQTHMNGDFIALDQGDVEDEQAQDARFRLVATLPRIWRVVLHPGSPLGWKPQDMAAHLSIERAALLLVHAVHNPPRRRYAAEARHSILASMASATSRLSGSTFIKRRRASSAS